MKRTSWEEANALAIRYCAAGSEAEKLKLQNLLFEQLFELALPDETKEDYEFAADALGRFFEKDWKNYDPAKGVFSHFFNFCFRRRKTDARNASRSDTVSLDVPLGDEEDGLTLQDTLVAPGTIDEGLDFGAPMLELLSAVLRLLAAPGKQNNPTRLNYCRMFFTQDISFYLRSSCRPKTLARREREILETMKLPFLDYTLTHLCRTLEAISRARLKRYDELVPGRPPEELREERSDLPADVYIAYLARVEGIQIGSSAVSNQLKFYSGVKESVLPR